MNTSDVMRYEAALRAAECAGLVIDTNTSCGRFYIRRDAKKHTEYAADNILYRCPDLSEVMAFIEGWTSSREFLKHEAH